MAKRFTSMQQKEIIKNICNLAYMNISLLSKEIQKLNITPEEAKDHTLERTQHANVLVSMMVMVQDCIHPAFEISKQVCAKESLNFIENVEKQHKIYKKNGLTLKCNCCDDFVAEAKPIKETDGN